MNYALFRGCNIPARLPQYETAARAVLKKLGVVLTDIREFSCCGYPLRNTDLTASLLSAARNLALAEQYRLPLLTLCKCGYGQLRFAAHHLKEQPALSAQLNTILSKEGLTYTGSSEIKHLLSVLYHDIGTAVIKEQVTRPFRDLKIATHYGCHALRPHEIVAFDDPVNPTIFDELVELTGAESPFWQARLECCGAPLFGSNDELACMLMEKKIHSARQAGAHYLTVGCPYCHLQFDAVQKMMTLTRETNHALAPILYPQLLALSMGLRGKEIGLEMNQLDITGVEEFLESSS
jgi:heterodisulfide reductase subunit B